MPSYISDKMIFVGVDQQWLFKSIQLNQYNLLLNVRLHKQLVAKRMVRDQCNTFKHLTKREMSLVVYFLNTFVLGMNILSFLLDKIVSRKKQKRGNT